MDCPSCQQANPREARFCMGCGRALAAAAPARERAPGRDGERRYITSMFCDLVDSTELSQRLDPEELSVAIGAYQELCAERIAAQEGTIAQYLGDGLLVYFGYPEAHEDDAVRAVQTALEILRELPALDEALAVRLPALRGRPLAVRIGIHTGEVVVGTLGRGRDGLAMGDTINITARLQGEAEAGTVVVSDATRRLVRDAFDLEGLGERSLKGIHEPLHVYRVLSGGGWTRREDEPLTPFVGREHELSLLLDQWDQVRQGCGQVALVAGEAGIGKSRLVRVLRERLQGQAHLWLEGRGSPYYENSAFHPVLALLRAEIELDAQPDPEARARRLEEALEPTGLPLDEVVPLLANLLSVPLPEGYAEPSARPDLERRRTLESLAAWLFRVSEDEPVVLVVEDLQWVDPSTIELLSLLVEQVAWRRLLLVLTFRPVFEPAFEPSSRVRSLSLNPLTRQQMAQMVESMRPGHRWSRELVQRIVSKADGVPLFVEELTRAVLESGAPAEPGGGGSTFAVPSTLQSSLTSRLDRLGPVKEIAQLASVLGREFSHELLVAVFPGDSEELLRGLDELSRAGVLRRRGETPRAGYAFKHALIRDSAYESMLRSARRRLHRRVARVLEEQFPERTRIEPELVARHYDEAGHEEAAARYYQKAAEQAVLRSANAEAIGHLGRGIEMLSRLAPSAESSERELNLQVQLGVLKMAAGGASDEDVERVFERARELCAEIGPTAETGLALFGLSVFHQARGELGTAVELGDRLLALAEQTGDSSLRVSAHLSLGIPLFWTGQPARAVGHLERAAELYDPNGHRALAFAYGQDPAVSARCYAAVCLWQLGSGDRAVRAAALAVGGAVDDLTLAFALTWAAWVDQLRGDATAVCRRAAEILEVAEKRGYVLWRGLGAVLEGWARAVRDRDAGAVDRLRQGLERLAETGTNVVGPAIVGLYGEALAAVGREADALSAFETALQMARQQATPYMDGELSRRKGEVLLRTDPSNRDEAGRLFQAALAESRARGMKGFELRAATSLARHLRDEGRKDEARRLLGGVYNGFGDAGGTADLDEARALLEDLG